MAAEFTTTKLNAETHLLLVSTAFFPTNEALLTEDL